MLRWAGPDRPGQTTARNQAEAQPSQTNSSQPLPQSSSEVMGQGGGARRQCPARQGAHLTPAVLLPAPAVQEVGAYRLYPGSVAPWLFWQPVSGLPPLFIGGSLFSLFAVFQRTSAADWQHGASHTRSMGPGRAEGGKKIAN